MQKSCLDLLVKAGGRLVLKLHLHLGPVGELIQNVKYKGRAKFLI